MWGLLFSLKDFSKQLATKPLDQLEKNPLISFQTNEYKISYYETLTGLRFVLCTDLAQAKETKSGQANSSSSSGDPLLAIYKLYVDLMVHNPFYRPGNVIECPVFHQRLDGLIESLPGFAPANQ